MTVSDFKFCKNSVNNAFEIGNALHDTSLLAEVFSCLAMLEYQQNNIGKSREAADLAIHFFSLKKNEAALVRMNTNFANIEVNESKEKALDYCFKALKLIQSVPITDSILIGTCYQMFSVIYTTYSEYENGLLYANKALDIGLAIGSNINLYSSYFDLCMAYTYRAEYASALRCGLASLRYTELLESDFSQAIIQQNIAGIYSGLNNFQMASEYFEKSLKISLKVNHKMLIISNYTELGNSLFKQNKLKEAIDNYQKSLTLSVADSLTSIIAENMGDIGMVYVKINEYEKAFEYLNKALLINKEIGATIYLAQNNLALGENVLRAPDNILKKQGINIQKKNQIAEKYFEEALKTVKYSGELDVQREAYLALSQLAQNDNNLKLSFDYYKKYILFKDSILNTNNLNNVANLQIQYETEKKEQQITLLNKDKKLGASELKRQKLIMNSTIGGIGIIGIFSFFLVRSFNRKKKTTFDKQVSEIEMKALRSQMNPHFIFNALQSVNDFILKKDTMNASNFLIKFSKLMRSVLENSVHKEVTIEKDIASLELYMQLESSRLDFPFDYEIIIDPKIDPETTFIPPLILQPFVENSIWHGLKHKKEKGKIKIEIKEESNSIICSIEDNGVGREKANTLKQPTPEKRESLGMKLTKERLRILEQIKNFRSRIDVIDLKDALNNPLGLRVELSLPLATLN